MYDRKYFEVVRNRIKKLLINRSVSDLYNTKKRRAFTLAEILITLMIIGVIATLTIPTLVNKIQDEDLKTAFKKEYSVISQATDLIINTNRSLIGHCQDNNCVVSTYGSYLSTVKSCTGGKDLLVGNCWHNDGQWYELDGDSMTDWYDQDGGLVLADGTLVDIDIWNSSCTSEATDTDHYPAHSFLICGTAYIDVNGFKAPNTIGKDIFILYLQKDGIKPGGSAMSGYDISYYPCDTDNSGISCASSVLMGK